MHAMVDGTPKRPPEHGQDQVSEPGARAGKRRRVGLACNACRTRKSRCDGQRPVCSSCLSLSFDCLYEPSESATNVIVPKDYVSDLEQRVTSVEHTLQRLSDVLKGHLSPCGNNSSCTTSIVQAFASPAATIQEKGTRVTGLEEPQDEDASTNGMAMTFVEEQSSAFFGESSNIQFTQLLLQGIAAVHRSSPAAPSALGRDSALGESIVASIPQSQSYPVLLASTSPLDSSPTALPPIEEMDNLLDIYFDSAGAVFPFIHEETMRNTYAEFRLNGFTRARRTWLGTLNMMFAIASSFDKDHHASAKKRFERSNVFYKRALELCGELAKRVISLEIVQYLLLVVIHCQGTQRSVQAWNNHGLLVRSAVALGLHTESARRSIDPIQEEYRRRSWVVIYCLDKVLSVAFGRPASVPDELMTRQESVLRFAALAPNDPNGNVDLPGEFLAVSFRLYQVMSKSLIDQYGANLENTDSDPDDIASLKASGELRKTINIWAASLPSHLRLCEPDSDIISQNTPANRFRVILTLRYHNLGILINKPSLSATIRHLFKPENATSGSPPYLIQVAMAEAHECIRSAQLTIDVVHSIISADPTSKNNLGAWFFTLYYVFTASLVICGRLLWAQHGQNVVDEAAVNHSKALLDKVETIFHKLDYENSLVLSCLEYIHRFAKMCSIKGAGPSTSQGRAEAASILNNAISDTQSTAYSPTTGLSETMPPNVENMDAFQLVAPEMFDPSIFESFHQSPLTRITFAAHSWEGFPEGG
ncbi:C6 transcription factor [Xylariales sp. PMI_506]|nr:C6 transcription factor [Xylariales sp. PMI_506]